MIWSRPSRTGAGEGSLGFIATERSSAAPRPLRRCYDEAALAHLHWLDEHCPAGLREEALLGFVREPRRSRPTCIRAERAPSVSQTSAEVGMGRVVEGQWVSDEVAAATDAKGRWQRAPTVVRDWIRADGSTPFAPEAGRYHLWLAWNCTWSQRTLIVRNLLGLQDAIGFTMAHWHRNEGGWWFREGLDALQPDADQAWESWDEEHGFRPAPPDRGLSLWRVYVAGDPGYTGRATVPLLWDRRGGRLVSNESSEILRMVEQEFGALGNGVDLLPADLREDIDETNAWVYEGINNGVYKAGFARTQGAHREAVEAVFAALERAEARLARHRYLCGDVLTEADVRLFPTLVRFDAVYYGHFRCNLRRIAEFPQLGGYLRDLYQTPGFAETVRLHFYKLGYMGRSERLNPSRIIPLGPPVALDRPHDRDRLGPRRIGG